MKGAVFKHRALEGEKETEGDLEPLSTSERRSTKIGLSRAIGVYMGRKNSGAPPEGGTCQNIHSKNRESHIEAENADRKGSGKRRRFTKADGQD